MDKLLGIFCPRLADEFARLEALKGPELLGEVVSSAGSLVFALFFGRGEACSRFLDRLHAVRRFLRRARLAMGGASHDEIQLDLRAQAKRHRIHRFDVLRIPMTAI